MKKINKIKNKIEAHFFSIPDLLLTQLWKWLDTKSKMLELDHVAQVIEAQSFGLDRLSSEQLDQLKKHQESTMALEQRKNYFKTADHSKTFHGLIIPHIVSVLKSDPKLKSVLNIGCNYGYMDSIMAKQFPQVKFSGIDVNENIKEYNKDLILPNLEFISGYALEKLESNKLAADLVYFSSTATVIRNNELKKYFSILVNKSKYVAISEPIWPLPNKKNNCSTRDFCTEITTCFYSEKPINKPIRLSLLCA